MIVMLVNWVLVLVEVIWLSCCNSAVGVFLIWVSVRVAVVSFFMVVADSILCLMMLLIMSRKCFFDSSITLY